MHANLFTRGLPSPNGKVSPAASAFPNNHCTLKKKKKKNTKESKIIIMLRLISQMLIS